MNHQGHQVHQEFRIHRREAARCPELCLFLVFLVTLVLPSAFLHRRAGCLYGHFDPVRIIRVIRRIRGSDPSAGSAGAREWRILAEADLNFRRFKPRSDPKGVPPVRPRRQFVARPSRSSIWMAVSSGTASTRHFRGVVQEGQASGRSGLSPLQSTGISFQPP